MKPCCISIYLRIQNESKSRIHPIKIVIDEDRKMKLQTPSQEIQIHYLLLLTNLPIMTKKFTFISEKGVVSVIFIFLSLNDNLTGYIYTFDSPCIKLERATRSLTN